MTISSTTYRNDYTAAAAQTVFPYTFKILETSELTVYCDGTLKTETTDYTVSGAGNAGGGNVTFLAAPGAGVAVAIIDVPSLTQETAYVQNDAFNASTHENALDKLTRIALYLKGLISQSLLLPIYSTLTDLSLPTPVADEFLRWNSTATGLTSIGMGSVGTLAYSAYGATLIDDADASTALTTLGVSGFMKEVLDDTTSATARATLGITTPTNTNQQTIDNLSYTATVAGKALTISLKGSDGNAPSSTNVVTIGFRSSTLTTGAPVFRTVTGATTVTLSSGSTLGFTSALAGRIYIWAIDNAGTVELALSRTADIFPEDKLVSTTAEGGAGAADSSTVMYSTSARASVACRCIGYIEITTGATAGEWDNSPTKIQVMGTGVKRTGDTVQKVYSYSQTAGSGGTVTPQDDTTPTIAEGNDVGLSCVIYPTSAINHIYVSHQGVYDYGGAGSLCVALHAGGAAVATAMKGNAGATEPNSVAIDYKVIPNSTSSITYTVRAGHSSGTVYWNRRSDNTYYNSTLISTLIATEVFA